MPSISIEDAQKLQDAWTIVERMHQNSRGLASSIATVQTLADRAHLSGEVARLRLGLYTVSCLLNDLLTAPTYADQEETTGASVSP